MMALDGSQGADVVYGKAPFRAPGETSSQKKSHRQDFLSPAGNQMIDFEIPTDCRRFSSDEPAAVLDALLSMSEIAIRFIRGHGELDRASSGRCRSSMTASSRLCRARPAYTFGQDDQFRIGCDHRFFRPSIGVSALYAGKIGLFAAVLDGDSLFGEFPGSSSKRKPGWTSLIIAVNVLRRRTDIHAGADPANM